MNKGESSVREYNTMFLAGGLVDKHDKPTLAALEIDESDTPSDTNCSSTESDDSVSDDSISDDSGKRPKKKARTEKDHNDDIDDGEQETKTDVEYESEWSPPNLVEGSDDESDSKVDLEDYQEYIEDVGVKIGHDGINV
ncbi:hypothetical protein DY000_02041520 [Brassica cretica]|uniref:Uncharacterized protein n=1 Tax=Brassica cretica TaxID=69181 RepID=A0ABQ7BIT5_BRACR|nr:hypothetical protein DY000_02041520 [Brassica cretica]